MDLPDHLLLSNIIKKSVYFDKKSKEPTTGKTKEKYKLAGNSILGKYYFNFLTKNFGSCKPETTLCIKQTDWEAKANGRYLTRKESYCDLTKSEWLNESVLLDKIRDRQNGFRYVARLCDARYVELQKLRRRIGGYSYIPTEKRNMIKQGLTNNIDNLMKKLELKTPKSKT